jgi:hypothetical protein
VVQQNQFSVKRRGTRCRCMVKRWEKRWSNGGKAVFKRSEPMVQGFHCRTSGVWGDVVQCAEPWVWDFLERQNQCS